MGLDGLTRERWGERWATSRIDYDPASEPQLRDSLDLIKRCWPEPTGRFLEAGCGGAANALNLAMLGAEVAGVDISPEAVRLARAAFAERGVSGEFMQGDVRALPFPDCSFDFIYAGGVVEHFLETRQAISELTRVVKPGGGVLVTVPALTLSYPYLFLRGNVPAVPLVETAMAFVQIRLLRGRLAGFGYERSFTRRSFRRLMRDAGLANVEVARFDTHVPLLPVPRALRRVARRLARTNLFAPMYFGSGSKPVSGTSPHATV